MSWSPEAEAGGRLWHDEAGQDLTEYALQLLVLIALASIASMQVRAAAISNVYSNAAVTVANAT